MDVYFSFYLKNQMLLVNQCYPFDPIFIRVYQSIRLSKEVLTPTCVMHIRALLFYEIINSHWESN